MREENRAHRYMTMEEHGLIQEIYPDWQGNLAEREIELAMGFTGMGAPIGYFKDLEAREAGGTSWALRV
jgi:hypothetical protein